MYLPQRYGWEKRRDHISSLIVGGEMSREEGLAEMEKPTATDAFLREETEYILKNSTFQKKNGERFLKLHIKQLMIIKVIKMYLLRLEDW